MADYTFQFGRSFFSRFINLCAAEEQLLALQWGKIENGGHLTSSLTSLRRRLWREAFMLNDHFIMVRH